jgi:hypothetical protein
MGPEDNPADDVQPTKEEWEAFELRAATARVRRANAGESCLTIYGVSEPGLGFEALAADCRRLADAYVADHP